jgi:hypothetical protein
MPLLGRCVFFPGADKAMITSKGKFVSSSNSTRRLLFLLCVLLALALMPFCALWNESHFEASGTPLWFLLVMFTTFAVGITALFLGRSPWRWILMLVLLPFAWYCVAEAREAYSIWMALRR